MNKKFIIPIMCLVVLIVGFIFLYLYNNRTISIVTLDINPSIEIRLKKGEKVKKVIALNDDAKKVIDSEIKGKTFNKALEIISDNIKEKGFVDEDRTLEILVYAKGDIFDSKLQERIENIFGDNEIAAHVNIVEKITSEDKSLSSKYDISPAKASYINKILEENKNIKIDTLLDRSVNEIIETKQSGRYCDKDYTLEGQFCVKEIGKDAASTGKICPKGYTMIDSTCYKEDGGTESDNYFCNEGFELENNKCIRIETINAEGTYTCDKGKLIKRGEAYREYRDKGDYEEATCQDESTGKKPTLRCLAQEHIIVDGKCGMGPKPLLPTATGCTPEDVNINGGCYDFNHENEWVCPSSGIYEIEDMICPETITYTKAKLTGYTCPDNYKLNNDKCIKEEEMPAEKERKCPSGYILTKENRCINYNDIKEQVEGYVCEEVDTRLKGDTCIKLEIKEAKSS